MSHQTSDTQEPIQFKNIAPDDKEWTAYIDLLNKWSPADYQLRQIVGYIQSGPHYPKHMHQDLIEQYFALDKAAAVQAAILETWNYSREGYNSEYSGLTHIGGKRFTVEETESKVLSDVIAQLQGGKDNE